MHNNVNSEIPEKTKRTEDIAVEMKGIVKKFPGIVANDHIDFELRTGEIHALLGENGAGKTTLMNILYGLYKPDEGEIYIRGKKAQIESPRDAIRLGIGMVHQHFMLVPKFTVAENIVLGQRGPKWPLLDLVEIEKKIIELSEKYGLKVNPRAKIWQLSAGEQQRVEILKILYRGADILILDEPTSVLTPQETESLFRTLKSMKKEGKSIIFITHKLDEVMRVSDRVTVLRRGRVIGRVDTKDTDKHELAKMMVGREVLFAIRRKPTKIGKVVLEVKDLMTMSDQGLVALKGVSFAIHQGEILGIAGVAGNGQRELAEVIVGLRKAIKGKVLIEGKDITNSPPRQILKQGVAYIPEERLKRGLIGEFSVAENLVLKEKFLRTFADGWFLPVSKPLFLNKEKIYNYTNQLVKEYNIKTVSASSPANQLSGGNIQRMILARELTQTPKLIIAVQPTMGLDVGATEFIRSKILEQKERGAAILLISGDLDEILMISDRILVMYEGRIVGEMLSEEADIDRIGLLMAGVTS